MNKIIFTTLSLLIGYSSIAQDESKKRNDYVDLGFGIGDKVQAVNLGYFYSWNLSKEKKILKNMYVGTGIRFTGFFGSYVSFQSAPPSLHTIKEKEDTLKAPSPKIYAANLLINLGYNFSQKLQVGFDIDAIGFSFGPKGSPKFVSEGESEVAFASPTSFNALLIGANDLGSLQSGLYVRYKFAKNLGVRASYHLLFTELTTSETLQTVPENNKRFRNSSNLIGFGLSYHF